MGAGAVKGGFDAAVASTTDDDLQHFLKQLSENQQERLLNNLSLVSRNTTRAATRMRIKPLSKTSVLRRRVRFNTKSKACCVGWIRFKYLRELQGEPLLRRQDLEMIAGALHIGAPPHESTLWIISHPWLGKEHPDATGEQVSEVVQILFRQGAVDSDVVFYDYGSMYQKAVSGQDDRTGDQMEAFFNQLSCINDLYATEFGHSIVTKSIPESIKDRTEVEMSYDGIEYTVELNSVPYMQRGWCFFEFVVMILFGTCINLGPHDEGILRELLASILADTKDNYRKEYLIEAGVRTIYGLCDEDRRAKDELVMDRVLDNQDIVLLKYSFLKELVETGGLLEKRQDMPAAAFGNWRATHQIFTIVYAHAKEGHADPKGITLNGIVSRLQSLGVGDNALVSLDWSCLYQKPRSAEDDASHRRALDAITSTAGTCSGRRFKVIVLTEANLDGQQFHEKAWCRSELFFSVFAGNLIFDVPEVLDIIVEKFFNTNLELKSFTNGTSNKALVASLFKSLLYERAAMTDLDDSKDRKIKELKAQIKTLEAAANDAEANISSS